MNFDTREKEFLEWKKKKKKEEREGEERRKET